MQPLGPAQNGEQVGVGNAKGIATRVRGVSQLLIEALKLTGDPL